jgi:ankyrin repeat protein
LPPLPTATPHAMELEPCAHCGAPGAPTFCAACRAVRYCGTACQRANWREHKPRCDYAAPQFCGVHASAEAAVLDKRLQKYVASLPTGNALAALLRHVSPSTRAELVARCIEALDVDRVSVAFSPALGVSTSLRVHGGSDFISSSLLYCAARNLTNMRTLHPDLQERALAVWEAVVDAAPLSQLNGTGDFASRVIEADGSMSNWRPSTALCEVCLSCTRALAPRAVASLLRRGVDVNRHSDDGTTPLLAAVKHQNAALVCQLLNAGAATSARGARGYTALHFLAGMECPAAAAKVRLLAEAGADLEAVNLDGCTPLLLAIERSCGSLRAFDALLAVGASTAPLSTPLPVPHLGVSFTALHFAAYDKNTPGVRRLLGLRGGSTDVDATVVAVAGSARNDAEHSSIFPGATALHIAAMAGLTARHEIVCSLLSAGANLHAIDETGRTPFLWALHRLTPLAVVKALLAGGAADHDGDLATAASYACAVIHELYAPRGIRRAGGAVSAQMLASGRANAAAALGLLLAECARRRVAVPCYDLAHVPPGVVPPELQAAVRALADSQPPS